jgi:hypothetical protein
MQTAYLAIVQTSPSCVAYRLLDPETGKVIWRNRVDPSDEGHAGARDRMAAWAVAHQVEVVEPQPEQKAVVDEEVERH